MSAVELPASKNPEVIIFDPIATLPETSLCFFLIFREITRGKWTPVYKSEIKRPESGAFRWNQVQVGSTDLCGDDIERPIKIEFFKSDTSGKHKLISACDSLTLGVFKAGTTNFQFKKGTLETKNLKVERQHSFLEYIFGGCEVDLSIAVDFTLSNGDPSR